MLAEDLTNAMRREQRDRALDPGPVTPQDLVEIANHDPIVHRVLQMFLAGHCRYDEALAIAVKALSEQCQELRSIAADLAARQMPPPMAATLTPATPLSPQDFTEGMQKLAEKVLQRAYDERGFEALEEGC